MAVLLRKGIKNSHKLQLSFTLMGHEELNFVVNQKKSFLSPITDSFNRELIFKAASICDLASLKTDSMRFESLLGAP